MTENVKGFAKLVGVPKMTESERFMVEDLARSWLTPADMPYGVKTLLLSKDGVSGYKILYDGAGKYWRIRHNREEAKYTSPKEKPAQRFMPRDLAAFSKAKIVGIVEGEKKAAAALRFAGLPAIGIGGCWNWCESTEDREAKQICLEILDNVTPDQVILCCLDGDWRNNENVQRAVATLALELEALGLHAHFPDFGNAGGLDDWIIAKYERKENVPEPELIKTKVA